MVPGEWLLCDKAIEINAGRRKRKITVRNTGDRAIQVGSHFHFFEVNRVLDFDRAASVGMRLDVPSGLSIRIEAGDEREVALVEFGGLQRVTGFNNLLNGATSSPMTVERALRHAELRGFSGVHQSPIYQSTIGLEAVSPEGADEMTDHVNESRMSRTRS